MKSTACQSFKALLTFVIVLSFPAASIAGLADRPGSSEPIFSLTDTPEPIVFSSLHPAPVREDQAFSLPPNHLTDTPTGSLIWRPTASTEDSNLGFSSLDLISDEITLTTVPESLDFAILVAGAIVLISFLRWRNRQLA